MSGSKKLKQQSILILKWCLLVLVVSIFAGVLSAIFLASLDGVTAFREQHQWLIYLLPFAGLLIGFGYNYYGKTVERGNSLVFDTIHQPKDLIPFRMIPLVLGGTLITHLFGGSAGREGTALQMSAAATDQSQKHFKLRSQDRLILLIAALSAGFASVFGTPIAGAIFGMEVLLIRNIPLKAIVPAIAAAFLAALVTELLGIAHTAYHIDFIPKISMMAIGYSILAGIIFGITAIIFVKLTRLISDWSKMIKYPPLRPFAGGMVLIGLVLLLSAQKFVGLGIPVIVEAFSHTSMPTDFAVKILLTAITLGMGFKGGEVTPLFFIGATLGSALSLIFHLPVALMAGMGFVSVFSGAAKTPIACIALSAELFGITGCIYMAIACIVSYVVSGRHSIYNAPANKQPQHFLFGSHLNFTNPFHTQL